MIKYGTIVVTVIFAIINYFSVNNGKLLQALFAWTNNVWTYHGSSTTHSESTSHYEWRLDILTGFIHYANLTLVFPDNAEAEDYAKKVKALLG